MRRRIRSRSLSKQELLRPRWLNRQAVRRARLQLLVLLPLVIGLLALYAYRDALFGPEWDTFVRILTAATSIVAAAEGSK